MIVASRVGGHFVLNHNIPCIRVVKVYVSRGSLCEMTFLASDISTIRRASVCPSTNIIDWETVKLLSFVYLILN